MKHDPVILIEVVEDATGKVIHTVDVSKQSVSGVDKVYRAMLYRMDRDKFELREVRASEVAKRGCPVCGRPRPVCRRNYARRVARWDAMSPAEKAARLTRTLRSTYPEPCR